MPAAALEVRTVSRFFRALGDETRLRIVALLSHGELCVCHIQEALELSQPNISRQLGVLRAAGIVEDRREGNWVYYRLVEQTDADCQRHLSGLIGSFAQLGKLRRDVEKVMKRTGPGACE